MDFEETFNVDEFRDSLEEIITECLNKFDHPTEHGIEEPGFDYSTDPHSRYEQLQERFDSLGDKLDAIDTRFDSLEEKMDAIELNMVPLLDLLNNLIKTNISEDTLGPPEPKEVKPELSYRVEGDNVYIYGTKTFDNKEIIKSSFKNTSWSKENSSWTFKVFDNYEKTFETFFPNIVKDQ